MSIKSGEFRNPEKVKDNFRILVTFRRLKMKNRTFEITAGLFFLAISLVPAAGQGILVPVDPTRAISNQYVINSLTADIQVRGQLMSVSTEQEFENISGGLLEAEFFLPVPPDTAVDSMTLLVNGKEFSAKLLKADEARKIYEEIVRKRKDPALLEYAGYNLFRTRAFPLERGKPAKIQITYKTLCRKDGNMVEVWYPLNSGKYSSRNIGQIKIDIDIKADHSVAGIYSPTHELSISRKADNNVIATYDRKNIVPVEDIQLFFEQPADVIGSGMITYVPKDENQKGYFLMLLSPNPTQEDKPQPKDVVLVLDRSGSMGGDKIRQAKAAFNFVLNHLNPADRFNVVIYSDSVEVLFDKMLDVSKENIARAAAEIDAVTARGGTNIYDAVAAALAAMQPSPDALRPGYVMFLTDGLPTVGASTDTQTIIKHAVEANKSNARIFAFGVGYDVNVPLLDKLTDGNHGRSSYVRPNQSVEAIIASLYNKIRNPVMTNLSVTLKDVAISEMYPAAPGDLFAGDQIVIAGRFSLADAQKLSHGQSQIIVKGNLRGSEQTFEFPVVMNLNAARANEFIERLWAIRRVGYLMDQVQLHGKTKEVEDEIIALATKYGIMTPYTSFLADESTNLADRPAVMLRVREKLYSLKAAKTKADAQQAAGMRNSLNLAQQVTAAEAAKSTSTPDSLSTPAAPTSKMHGNSSIADFEADKKEAVANVRQIRSQNLYKRGNMWIAANAQHLDIEKDAAKIQHVKRFSDEYFRMIKENTQDENAVLATQQAGEQILICLRGQAYIIE